MFLSIFLCVCLGLVSSLPNAQLQYRDLYFYAKFITQPKNSESVLVAVNETVGRVNDVYLLIDASVLKFLEHCQVVVSFDPIPNYVYALAALAIILYICTCISVIVQCRNLPGPIFLTFSISPFNTECPICLESNCNVAISKCKHAFHLKCIQKWFLKKQSCPLCNF